MTVDIRLNNMVDGYRPDGNAYCLNSEPGKMAVGERFELTNPDKPAWCDGWFEVLSLTPDGRYYCKRVEGPGK